MIDEGGFQFESILGEAVAQKVAFVQPIRRGDTLAYHPKLTLTKNIELYRNIPNLSSTHRLGGGWRSHPKTWG